MDNRDTKKKKAVNSYLFKDEGERGVITADASDGRLQRQEAVFLNSRRDLTRKTTSVLQKKEI